MSTKVIKINSGGYLQEVPVADAADIASHYKYYHARAQYCEDKAVTADGLDTGQQCWVDATKAVTLYNQTIAWSLDRLTATETENYYTDAGVLAGQVVTVHTYDSDGNWLNGTQTVPVGSGGS